MKETACCITGHRPGKLKWGYDEEYPNCIALKQLMEHELSKLVNRGVDTFFIGMAVGIDIWAGEIILKMKQENPGRALHLMAVLPFEGQANRWSDEYRERYFIILEHADDVVTLHTHYTKTCM